MIAGSYPIDERKVQGEIGKHRSAIGGAVESVEHPWLLPKHFAVRSKLNNLYLRYVDDDDKLRGYLRFKGDRVVSPLNKFISEASQSNKRHVHIRCDYNNKYWSREAAGSFYMAAAADKTEEDSSKWNCTLFEPIFDSNNRAYHFRHVQSGQILYHTTIIITWVDCLILRDPGATMPDDDPSLLSTVIDWDTLYILPRHIAFKGVNGKYLKYFDDRYHTPYMKFNGDDASDPLVAHEIFPTKEGFIRVKNTHSGKFWDFSRRYKLLVATSSEDSNDKKTKYWPFGLADNGVALCNLENGLFLRRISVNNFQDAAMAHIETITEDVRMKVTELVDFRVIENIKYRTNDARIYGHKVLTLTHGDAINKTKGTDTITFKFSYEKKKKKQWSSSLGSKLAVNSKISGDIPVVGDASVSLEKEVGKEYSWGEEHKDKVTVETTHTVTVQPMSRVKIDGIISEAKCDVPFSYNQIDTLKGGKKVTHRFKDGLFRGVNSYDFKFEAVKVEM